MNEIAPIVDFDDKTYDPFTVDDAAYGDIEDIHALLADLMAKAPVHQGDPLTLLGWQSDPHQASFRHFTVVGYDEYMAVDGDAETFSIEPNVRGIGRTMGRTLSLLDPPEHTHIRKVFQKAFLPHIVGKWGETLVQPVVNGIIDRFVDRGHAELAGDFAINYPFEIIYRQLALPERDIATFHKLAVTMTQTFGDCIRYGEEASRKLGTYFSEMVARRRGKQGDDLVSLLANAEVDGDHIPDETLISFFRQLINAAGDTTYRATGTLLIGLLREPNQLEAVRADRTLVPLAIDETLRWDGPTVVHPRMATRDVTLGGVDIPKGSIVNAVNAAASNDPKVYPEPRKFNIHRKRERHFGFGYGPHVCLGQHLARVEMSRALNAILDRLPNLRFHPDKPEPRISGIYLRTPRDIHVLFG